MVSPVGMYGCERRTIKKAAGLSRSVVSDSATPETVARQAPLPWGFSRQEHCGLALPSPRGLPNSGFKPRSQTLQEDSLPPEPPVKAECGRTDAFKLWCCKEINPVNPKWIQPWRFIRRTDAEAEAAIFWPPDEKSRLTGKDPDVGKAWGQEEKGTTEDEMVGWHHWLKAYESEQTQWESEGQMKPGVRQSMGSQSVDTT